MAFIAALCQNLKSEPEDRRPRRAYGAAGERRPADRHRGRDRADPAPVGRGDRDSTMAVYTHFGGMAYLRQEVRREGFARLRTHLEWVEPTNDPVTDWPGSAASTTTTPGRTRTSIAPCSWTIRGRTATSTSAGHLRPAGGGRASVHRHRPLLPRRSGADGPATVVGRARRDGPGAVRPARGRPRVGHAGEHLAGTSASPSAMTRPGWTARWPRPRRAAGGPAGPGRQPAGSTPGTARRRNERTRSGRRVPEHHDAFDATTSPVCLV